MRSIFWAPPCGPTGKIKKKKPPTKSKWFIMSALPIFPGGCPPSIFGTFELNYRVRDGNGWTLKVINTD